MPGTGYTSIADYLGANQGTLDNERQNLARGAGQELDAAKTAADQVIDSAKPGTDYTTTQGYGDALQKVNGAQQDAANLGTLGGLTDAFERRYNEGAGQGAFDSALVYGAPQFASDQQRGQGLLDYLNNGLQTATKPGDTPGLQGDVDAQPPATLSSAAKWQQSHGPRFGESGDAQPDPTMTDDQQEQQGAPPRLRGRH